MSVRTVIAFLLIASPQLYGAYAYKATLSFPAATGGTATNLTAFFTGSNNVLKVTGSGGQVQHTATVNGVTVPTDLVLTTDSTCATTTGYSWSVKAYDATAGTIYAKVKIPSLTTGSPVSVTVCIGNAAVSTFQGGSIGSAYNSSVVGSWPLGNGTTLNANDFSASACNGAATGVSATSGSFDGAGNFTSTSSVIDLGGSTCGSTGGGVGGALDVVVFTLEGWINTSASGVYQDMYEATANGFPQFRIDSGNHLSLDNINTAGVATSTGTISTSTPTHVVITYDNGTGNYAFYINGTVSGSGTVTPPGSWSLFSFRFANHTWQMGYLNQTPTMTMDDWVLSNAVQPASWIATEYANQSSPPAMTSFTSLVVASVVNSGSYIL